MYFDEKKASEVFRKLWLEGRYDFLIEDLVTLANAFAEAAKPKILQENVVKQLQEIRDGL